MTKKSRLQGLSVSSSVLSLLAREPEGNVHSVFRRSANLLLGPSELIGLVDADAGNAPNAVVLQTFDGDLPGLLPGFLPGMPMRCREGCILIGDGIAVELGGAQVWNPDPEPPAVLRTRAGLAETRMKLTEAIDAWGSEAGLRAAVMAALKRDDAGSPGLGSPGDAGREMDRLGQIAQPRLKRLFDAFSRHDGPETLAAALSLVGLGPGLTPSGDDFLAAFAGTMVLGERWGIGANPATAGLVRGLAAGIRGKTTLAGETLLRPALEGHLPEHLAEMIRELVGASVDSSPGIAAGCTPKIQKVLAWGSTSGTDLACGTLAALDFLIRNR